MFLIYPSVGKVQFIPKRYFAGPHELKCFTDIVTGAIVPKKRRLKLYNFTAFSPVAGLDGSVQNRSFCQSPISAGQPEVPKPGASMSFKVVPTKREYIKFNFTHTYSTPAGIIVTLIGVLLLVLNGIRIPTADMTDLFDLVLRMVLGIFLIIGTPLLLLINTNRIYKSDASFRKGVTYFLYQDHLEILSEQGLNRLSFGDFRKLKKYNWCYLMFITNKLTYFIPTRCIGDGVAFEMHFNNMKAENKRLKSYAATNPPTPPAA
jgi:hypothetical protein